METSIRFLECLGHHVECLDKGLQPTQLVIDIHIFLLGILRINEAQHHCTGIIQCSVLISIKYLVSIFSHSSIMKSISFPCIIIHFVMVKYKFTVFVLWERCILPEFPHLKIFISSLLLYCLPIFKLDMFIIFFLR